MDITATRWRTRRRRPARHRGRVVTMLRAVTIVTACGVLVTACSHSSPGAGEASGPSSPDRSASAGPLAFAECMRAHGVLDFPDPDSNGSFNLSGGGDLTPTDPTYQAATQACRSLGSAGKASAPSFSRQQIAAILNFAECMRSHGIDNYPDPNSNGIIPGIRNFGIDPNSSQFQAANSACKHYVSGIPAQEAP